MLDGCEEPSMCLTNVRDDAMRWFSDAAEICNFAFVIHAHLDDSNFVFVVQSKQRHRNANMVVKIFFSPQYVVLST